MWPIVRDAFADASPAVRSQIKIVVATWLLLVLMQAWDSRDASGPAGVAEFLSAVLGASGVALLGTAHTLQRTLDSPSGRSGKDELAVRQALIALPGLGFAAGIALGAASALMALRVVLGVELVLAVVASTVYGVMLVFAGRTVNNSARTLFQYAASNAAIAADARGQAAAAQVAALQSRMNPHFLFNALNTVASVVRANPAAAERLVENLSDVLRTTLRRSSAPMSTLGEEIDYVRACLALEQERFGDRLRIEWTVDDRLRSAALPPLVLQPLVENALAHGIGAMADGGTIRISIIGDDDRMMLTVEDDGPGFPVSIVERTGLGNLRERLATLYGPRASMRLESLPPRGARISVSIPRR